LTAAPVTVFMKLARPALSLLKQALAPLEESA
jgi:hypothetical protein